VPLCVLVVGGGVSACAADNAPGCPGDIVATITPRADDAVLGAAPATATLPAYFMPQATLGWSTALHASTQTQLGVGFVAFTIPPAPSIPPTVLAIEVPFPVAAGQTLALSEGEPMDLTHFVQWLPVDPSPMGARAELDACGLVKQSAVGSCGMVAGQSVMGTLEIVSARPLEVHVAATFTTPDTLPTSDSLDADLTVVENPGFCGGGIRID
jgi:hypothetical protein